MIAVLQQLRQRLKLLQLQVRASLRGRVASNTTDTDIGRQKINAGADSGV